MAQGRFDECMRFVLKWEGSEFTNDSDDHGGPTRYGVTQAEYDRFLQRSGRPPGSVEFITLAEVNAIFLAGYWGPVGAEQTPSPLDLVTVDGAILMGPQRSVTLLQKALRVPADGQIGPVTTAALAAADVMAVATEIASRRDSAYRAIVANDSTQRKFLRGWLNRLNDLRRTAGIPVPLGLTEEVDNLGADPEFRGAVAVGRATGDIPARAAGMLVSEAGDDPASPLAAGLVGGEGYEEDRMLANFGDANGAAAAGAVQPLASARGDMPFDLGLARAFLKACENAVPPVGYELGRKVRSVDAVPGRDFQSLDCSGFVRETVLRATKRAVNFPDGSDVQHGWVRAQGFPRAAVPDGALMDGGVRIAFLRLQDSPTGVGHVALVSNGTTMECHVGKGVDSLPWTGSRWQAKAFVYVLKAPA